MKYQYKDIHKYDPIIGTIISTDTYQHSKIRKSISATKLLSPLKPTVLELLNKDETIEIDGDEIMSARIGTFVHLGLEEILTEENIQKHCALIKKKTGKLKIYKEIRTEKLLEGTDYYISGTFDLCINGQLYDFKTTSTFNYTNKKKHLDYIKQGSIYKWLNPGKIKRNTIRIIQFYTDWIRSKKGTHNYPNSKIQLVELDLWSLEQTEQYIRNRISLIDKYIENIEEIPDCNKDDLWVSEVFKVYDKHRYGEEIGSFYDLKDALQFKERNKFKYPQMFTRKFTSKPRACNYCNVLSFCEQGKQIIRQ